jgi:hypothetical protein
VSAEISYRIVCDAQACGEAGPVSLRGTIDAWNKAKKVGWEAVQVHFCGLCLHYCDKCSEVVQSCKICEKKTYDPRNDHCGSCGWKDSV